MHRPVKKNRPQVKTSKKIKYTKPQILNRFTEEDFVSKEMPFVGATSNYKTYIPIRPEVQPQLKQFQTKASIITQDDDDLFVAYDAESGKILEVNRSAYAVTIFCNKPKSLENVCGMLAETFCEIPNKKQLKSDTIGILSELVTESILIEIESTLSNGQKSKTTQG